MQGEGLIFIFILENYRFLATGMIKLSFEEENWISRQLGWSYFLPKKLTVPRAYTGICFVEFYQLFQLG